MGRLGSNATEPFGAGADQCLLFPASDQIADKSRMTKRAKSGQFSARFQAARCIGRVRSLTKMPVRYVATKMSRNGNHVPRMLPNIA